MPDTPRWRRYLRFLRPDPAADVDEELDLHLALRAERNIALGMSPDEARRDALRRFGDVSRVRYELVDHDQRRHTSRERVELMADLVQDLRFGWRTLRRAPAFTAAAILTLGIGVGANAAIFSVVDAVVLRPLPFARPQELIAIGSGSAGEFLALRERLRSFSQVAAYVTQWHPIHDGEEALRIEGAAVTTNTFALLGATPLLGRLFTDDESQLGNNASLIISHGLWQRQFGGATDIIGRRISVQGAPFSIVGVMPPGFHFPDKDAQYWQPYAFNPANVGLHWAVGGKTFIGRLAPGVTMQQAQREVAEVWPTLRRLNPLWDPGESYRRDIVVRPLQNEIVGAAGSTLWMLFGCVALVLIIGCINVANLLLARATARERELAVRAAIGGGRGRLVRQLLTESLLLSALGGVLGGVLALLGVRWIVAVLPDGVPRAHEIAVNGTVLAFTAAVAVLTGLVFGIVPALRATRFRTPAVAGGRRTTSDRSQHRLSGLLVASEIALAVLVVTASTLLVRSFAELRDVEPGFRTEQVVAARVSPPSLSYRDPARVAALYDGIVARVAGAPGVQSVGLVDKLPLAQSVWGMAIRVQGQYEDNSRILPEVAHMQMVSPGYFATLDIPVTRGRAFTEADREDQMPVAIVSESVARRFWPNGDAVGQRIGNPYPSPWITIVGVVADVKQDSLRDTSAASVYMPWLQRNRASGNEMWVLARTTGDIDALAQRMRSIAREADATVAVSDVRTMDAVLSGSVARARFTTLLVALFAVAALLLGAVGIYGVMSYVVGQRLPEMGIRLALGATPAQVRGIVLRRGATLAAAGVGVGIVGAMFATRALASLLYGVGILDPVTFAVVPLLFLLIAAFASWVPARRATRVDPAAALRVD